MGFFDLFKTKRPRSKPAADSGGSPSIEMSPEEKLLKSIKQFRQQQETHRKELVKQRQEELAPIQEKIARAENFICESGLDVAVPKIFQHIWHWASWSKLESFSEYAAFEAKQIFGDKNKHNGWYLSFEFNGKQYWFEFSEHQNDLSDNVMYGEMTLDFNDETVLKIDCKSNIDREYFDWSYVSVQRLVIGDWVRALVEMHELIKLYDMKKYRKVGEESYKHQAEGLPD